MANENLKAQKIYGKYIKDLPQVTEMNDTDDIIIEDSTPITSRAKLGVLFDSIKKRIAFTWRFSELNNQTIVEYASELNSKTSYNFESLAWTNPTYHITKKSGIVYIDYYCAVSGGASGMSFLIAQIPIAVRPDYTIKSQAWTANEAGQRHGASVEIRSNGQVYFVGGDRFVEAGFTISYPV